MQLQVARRALGRTTLPSAHSTLQRRAIDPSGKQGVCVRSAGFATKGSRAAYGTAPFSCRQRDGPVSGLSRGESDHLRDPHPGVRFCHEPASNDRSDRRRGCPCDSTRCLRDRCVGDDSARVLRCRCLGSHGRGTLRIVRRTCDPLGVAGAAGPFPGVTMVGRQSRGQRRSGR